MMHIEFVAERGIITDMGLAPMDSKNVADGIARPYESMLVEFLERSV